MDGKLSNVEEKLLSDAKDKNIRIHPLHSRVLTLEKLKGQNLLKLVRVSKTEYEYEITEDGRAASETGGGE